MILSRVVVLASNNTGKVAELTRILSPLGLTIHPLSHFTKQSVEETGTTFRENALLKARFAVGVACLPAIADDSGLEVDALNGAPGVYSARYAGEGASDAANNDKLIEALHGVPVHRRTARFRCVLAYLHDKTSDPIFTEGVWEGRILEVRRGAHGFGYDPLFVPNDSERSAAEMSGDQKNRVSHRAQALSALLARLQDREWRSESA